MRYVNGDLIDLYIKDQLDVIFQSANCQNTMKAGLAGKIAKIFPEVPEMDNLTKRGDPKKLGQFSFAFTDREATKVIISLYSQFFYGRKPDVCYTDYKAFENALQNARDWLLKAGLGGSRLGLSAGIGSGLGGGDKATIHGIIGWVFYKTDFDVVIVEYDPKCKK